LIDNLFHRIHAAQSGEARITQGVFDLSHPETDGALDALVHFADDGINQFSVSRNACQSRTQPFLMETNPYASA